MGQELRWGRRYLMVAPDHFRVEYAINPFMDLSAQPDPVRTREQWDASVPGALAVPFTSDFREDRREFERRYIARCLEETGGNVTRAAAILGMHRQSLQHKLRQLGLGRRYVTVGENGHENSDG